MTTQLWVYLKKLWNKQKGFQVNMITTAITLWIDASPHPPEFTSTYGFVVSTSLNTLRNFYTVLLFSLFIFQSSLALAAAIWQEDKEWDLSGRNTLQHAFSRDCIFCTPGYHGAWGAHMHPGGMSSKVYWRRQYCWWIDECTWKEMNSLEITEIN